MRHTKKRGVVCLCLGAGCGSPSSKHKQDNTFFFKVESMPPSVRQPYPYCWPSICRGDRHLFLLIFIDELLCCFVNSCHVPADGRQDNMFLVDIFIGFVGKIKFSIIYSLFTIARIF